MVGDRGEADGECQSQTKIKNSIREGNERGEETWIDSRRKGGWVQADDNWVDDLSIGWMTLRDFSMNAWVC